MSDENQVFVPSSFQDLYRDARGRWLSPMSEVASRYELCEDLAQHLCEPCRGVHIEIGADAIDVLERCLRGLEEAGSGVSAAEARWVVTRLAELLNWPAPPG